jgi:site-specific DNA-methyltransferase (adenine-specific)
VFGKENFRSEIVWKRRTGSSSRVHESTRFQTDTDSIFFYAKSALAPFTPQYTMDAEGYSEYLDKFFKYSDANGRKYRLADLANPSPRPNLMYEYKGYKPPKNGWAISLEKMQLWDAEGRLYFPANKEGRIQRKRFLDEVKGKPVQGLWDDIEPIGAHAAERLGYPTQKPLALLERIVNASSREGDVVLDPFCGCGTAVHAAQKLKRQWIGIDITHLAITLIEKRLKDAFPEIGFEVHGTPKDLEGAMDLARRDKYQFQWWACSLVNAQPYQGKKKGADGGIDGLIFFLDDTKEHRKIVVSVKGGDNVSVAMVRDLIGVLEREEAEIGLFITLSQPTRPMITEAVKAGYYTSTVTGKDFRKLQILTIAGLLSGNEKAEYPDLARGATTFKKARVEAKTGKQGDMF